MDAVADFLDGPRARGAFLLRSVLDPPWSLRIEDRAPLTLVAVVQEHAWIVPDDAEAQRLQPGDVALLRGPAPYTVADDPATPPDAVIHPGQRCTTPDGRELDTLTHLGARTWGRAAGGRTVLLTGTYETAGEVSRRVLDALPPLVVLTATGCDNALVALLAAEIERDEPGQEAVLDRLLDLLLVASLRTWFGRPEAVAPAWFRAHHDPLVGPALRLLDHEPGRPWTVASLAAAVGVGRATLARHFRDQTGETPMSYLADRRLTLAADLLRDGITSVGAIAGRVGYTSPFTFSTAFKRRYGTSPSEYRRISLPRS
jgi:AraC-like DNA-binding protein